MANQRTRLKQFYKRQPMYYVATFDHISHKTNAQGKQVPVALIKDIILIDPFGHMLAPRNFGKLEVVKRPYVVTDHTWVNFTKVWFELPVELVPGDQVMFAASVERYRINRTDVLEKRDKIWTDTLAENDRLYKQWHNKSKSNPGLNFNVSFNKMKEQQQANLEDAKEQQKNLDLVDYSLSRIKDLRILRMNPKAKKIKRGNYDYEQYIKMGYQYSFWLSNRSTKLLKVINSQHP